MSSMKRNILNLIRVAWLLTVASFPFLNGYGDTSSQEEQRAKAMGITPAQLNAIKERAEELGREYSAALKSPDAANQFQTIMRKAISNIDAASKPAITDGKKLPTSFTDHYFPKHQVKDANQTKADDMGLSMDTYLDQYTLAWAGQLINTAPEVLMPILEERAKVFPPTAADYILYGTIRTALDDNNYDLTPHGSPTDPNQVSPTRSAGLLQLAQAKNPVYRLLAAEAADYVEPDKNKRVNFYSAYLNETDPVIQTTAIKGVASTQTPATVGVLQSFQTAAHQNGNAEGADAAQKAIQRLSK
jgi:hypothetical protein